MKLACFHEFYFIKNKIMKATTFKNCFLLLVFANALLSSCKNNTTDSATTTETTSSTSAASTDTITKTDTTSTTKPLLRKNSADGTNSAL